MRFSWSTMAGSGWTSQGSVKAYLCTTARNLAINRLNKRSGVSEVPLDELAPSGEETESAAIRNLEAEALVNAVLALGEPDCKIILYRYYFNLPSKQIASLLGLKQNTIDQRMRRALQKLNRLSKGGDLYDNNRSPRFPALNVAQTQRLLSDVKELPLSIATSRRIRASVLKKAAPKALARNRIRKTLLPIAACLIAVVMFFVAFPKAALAVSEFIGRIFTPSRYMNQDPSERTPVPSIDEAIAAAAPQDGDYTITLMSELPNAQEFIDYRTATGMPPFSEENRVKLRDIRPRLRRCSTMATSRSEHESLHDQRARAGIYGRFRINSGSKLSVDALLDSATYSVAGDPTVYQLITWAAASQF
ncbi:MAG: sigma-70 family RNA polymerase sigma factor [Eubacteriales bacterium]